MAEKKELSAVETSSLSDVASQQTAYDLGKPAYVHTLSLRLTDNEYRRLRRFVAAQEDRLGRRLTHQAVLEAALHQYLERRKDEVG